MAPNSNLVCKECGYVNEAERVYCHGCGAKLDRTVILAEEEKHFVSREEQQRQVKKLMTPRGAGFAGREIAMLFKVVAGAALVAVVISMVTPPEGVPELPKKGELTDTPQLGDSLERLSLTPAGQAFIFREQDINNFLLKKPFRKVPSWFTDLVPLRRSFVNLDQGRFRLTVQGDLAGYPLYVALTGQPKSDPKAGLTVSWSALHLGRLTLPFAAVAQQAAAVLPTLMDSVKRETQLLGGFGAAEIAKGQVILRSRGPHAAPVPAPTLRPVAR